MPENYYGNPRDAVKNLRRKGMSERDSTLVSMKRNTKEKKTAGTPTPYSEDYPYGLKLDLDEDSLDKLGVDSLFDVGEKVKVSAEATVVSVSQRADSQGKNRSMCLQITKLGLD